MTRVMYVSTLLHPLNRSPTFAAVVGLAASLAEPLVLTGPLPSPPQQLGQDP